MTRHQAFLMLPILVIGALITACGMDPAKTEAFQKLDKKVKDLDEKLSSNTNKLLLDFDMMRDEIKNMPTKIKPDAGIANQLAAAVERINALEQEVKKLSEAQNKRETTPAVRTAPASDKPSAPGAAKPAARSSAPAKAQPKGSWYQVKEGDTLQGVAKAHGVTAKAICDANHLPLTAVPRAGSSLFIPGK
jgi:LysM repeat protein